MEKTDWNQLRAFLETAETGSLSAAARKLGLTQPTLSRQVVAIEQRMGVTLFERVGKTMAITPTGLDLLEHARAMGARPPKPWGWRLPADRRPSRAWSQSRPVTLLQPTSCPRWCGSCGSGNRAL